MNTEHSSTIPLSDVPVGARLTAAVLGADGQVLMTAGSLLTEAELGKLVQRGIAAVEIERQRDEAELRAARTALRQRLEHLFRRCDREADSGAQTLFDAVLAYRLEALQ